MKKTSYNFIKSTVVLILVALLVGCSLPASVSEVGAASVQIGQPQEGAQLKVGGVVSVISSFSDPGGAQGMILEVNGVGVREDKFHLPMFEGRMNQPWRPTQNGPATLCVYLTTSSGQVVRSNCVTVMIGSVVRATFTPGFTNTPFTELTFTPTPTFTPGAPTATATQDANCRQGPRVDYAVTSSLATGRTAPIVGRNTDQSWWVIRIPGSADCWIWDGTVTVEGDISAVPVITPPPAPIVTVTQPAPLTAPNLISPSGTLNCVDVTGGVTLSWSVVSHANGIDHYEWELNGSPSDSGNTGNAQASTSGLSCAGAIYQWRARAVDGKGNIGPWSGYMQFNVP